jgi:hypothetical protein
MAITRRFGFLRCRFGFLRCRFDRFRFRFGFRFGLHRYPVDLGFRLLAAGGQGQRAQGRRGRPGQTLSLHFDAALR